jgi:hypothetical protein
MYREDGLEQATEEWEAAARRYADKKRRLQEQARERRDRQVAVRFLNRHLGQRQEGKNDPVEVLEDGRITVFLTTGYVSRSLKRMGVTPNGEKYARRIIRLLCEMGHLEDTGRVKKPRASESERPRREKFTPALVVEGGQSAQSGPLRSYWWRVFALPRLGRLHVSAFGSWVTGFPRGRKHEASLSALLRRQDVVPNQRRRNRPHKGSVQWAFAHSGPP